MTTIYIYISKQTENALLKTLNYIYDTSDIYMEMILLEIKKQIEVFRFQFPAFVPNEPGSVPGSVCVTPDIIRAGV